MLGSVVWWRLRGLVGKKGKVVGTIINASVARAKGDCWVNG